MRVMESVKKLTELFRAASNAEKRKDIGFVIDFCLCVCFCFCFLPKSPLSSAQVLQMPKLLLVIPAWQAGMGVHSSESLAPLPAQMLVQMTPLCQSTVLRHCSWGTATTCLQGSQSYPVPLRGGQETLQHFPYKSLLPVPSLHMGCGLQRALTLISVFCLLSVKVTVPTPMKCVGSRQKSVLVLHVKTMQ